MSYEGMIQKELIKQHVMVDSEQELFEQISEELLEKEYVFPKFLKGITKREEEFPTGLMTQFLNIALPHADCVYIQKPFLYVVYLEQPIKVRQMGDNQEMTVNHLLFLGIKEPTKQVDLLSTLMRLFMDKVFVQAFKQAKGAEQVYQLLVNSMKEEERVEG